jgi:hypothetical protein
MNKQLVIIGIVAILITVGLSGCEKQNTITPANIIIKNITYSPSDPVSNEKINFTITLENSGERDVFSVISLNGKNRVSGNFTIRSQSFLIGGHSQKNVTLSTGENLINEGMQSFEIGITGNQTVRTINIYVEPNSPGVFYAVTGYLDELNNFVAKTIFTAGEPVILDYFFVNVNHEGQVETYQNVSVYHEGGLYNSINDEYKKRTDNETCQASWIFFVEESWPLGEYQIVIIIQDKITRLTCTKIMYFTVV